MSQGDVENHNRIKEDVKALVTNFDALIDLEGAAWNTEVEQAEILLNEVITTEKDNFGSLTASKLEEWDTVAAIAATSTRDLNTTKMSEMDAKIFDRTAAVESMVNELSTNFIDRFQEQIGQDIDTQVREVLVAVALDQKQGFIETIRDLRSNFFSALDVARSKLSSEISVEQNRFSAFVDGQRTALVGDINHSTKNLNEIAEAAQEALKVFAENQSNDIDYEAAIVAAIGKAEATFYQEQETLASDTRVKFEKLAAHMASATENLDVTHSSIHTMATEDTVEQMVKSFCLSEPLTSPDFFQDSQSNPNFSVMVHKELCSHILDDITPFETDS